LTEELKTEITAAVKDTTKEIVTAVTENFKALFCIWNQIRKDHTLRLLCLIGAVIPKSVLLNAIHQQKI
jgi:hypothetical protein